MRGSALLAGLIAVIAAVAAAVAYLATNSWFGASDLRGMVFWSLPLAICVAVGVRLTERWLHRRPAWVAYPAGLALGAAAGFVTFIVAALVLGPWIGAFSFPVLFCWVFGGAVSLIVTVWVGHRSTGIIAVLLLITGTVGLLRANAYAQAPAPRIRVYAKAQAAPAEVEQIWTEVLGRPHPSGQGHDLLDGLSSVGASGRDGPHEVLTVSFRKRTKRARRDTIVAWIRRSPLVARVEWVPTDDSSGVRVSSEY